MYFSRHRKKDLCCSWQDLRTRPAGFNSTERRWNGLCFQIHFPSVRLFSYLLAVLFVKVTYFRRGFSSKLHLTPVEYPPKSRHTPISQPQMHDITNGDQTPNQPFKRVKFSSPVSSPFTNQLSLNIKSRAPSGPVAPSIRIRASNSPHDTPSNLAVQATHYGTLSAHRHGSLSDFSTVPDARTFDLSDNSKSRLGPGKPLKTLASFLDGFLVMARNATQMQVEASSRSSVKRKRAKSIRPTNTNTTSNESSLLYSTLETARGDGDSRPLRPRSSRSMRSFTQTSRKPEVACQPLSPSKPVLLRTLTARSRLLLNSVRSATPVSPSIASMPSRPCSHSHTAAYINQLNQLHGEQVTESQSAPHNSTSSSLRRSLHQSFDPTSRPLVSSMSSPQQIIAALQPPKAQVVLSSTSTLSEGPPTFPAICTNDSNEHPGIETPDKQGIAPRSLVCWHLVLYYSNWPRVLHRRNGVEFIGLDFYVLVITSCSFTASKLYLQQSMITIFIMLRHLGIHVIFPDTWDIITFFLRTEFEYCRGK